MNSSQGVHATEPDFPTSHSPIGFISLPLTHLDRLRSQQMTNVMLHTISFSFALEKDQSIWLKRQQGFYPLFQVGVRELT